MAQYTEGQRLRGSDGNIYVVRNGQPVRDGGTSPLGNPKLPLEVRGAELQNARTQQEIDAANATADANARSARAAAQSAEIKAKQDQEAYNTAHPKGLNSTVMGQDFLKTLPLPDQELVKALADGRLAFPAGFALKAPWWQQKLQEVAQFDPSFDATNYNNRAKARGALLTGKLGSSANALNTAIGHVGMLGEQGDETASHNFTPLNAVENYLSQTFGGPGVTNFRDTAQKLADELESAYRNGGGAEQGVVRQLRSLDPNMSAAQKQGIIKNALELLSSKQAANLYQYNLGSGGKPEVDLLDPSARAVLDQFPDIRDKYFAPPQQLGKQAAALLEANGGTPPSGGGGGGGIDRTNYGGGSPVPPGGTSRTEPFPEASALIDSMVASGVPYASAVRQYRRQFPDQPVFAPQQYNDALAYHAKHPNDNGGYGAATKIVPLSQAEQSNNNLSQSGPVALAGHFANSSLAGLPALAAGDQGAYFNALSQQQHPYLSGAGDIGGAIAGTGGIGKALKPGMGAASELLADFSPRASRLLASPATRMASADALYGGTFGATQNPGNPVGGAAEGAAAMLAGNVAGRYALGPALGAAGNSRLGQKALGMFGSTPTPRLPVEQRMILGQAGKASPDVLSTLDEAANLNLPYALADASPKLRALTGTAVRKSPNVLNLAESTLEPRNLGQADRAVAAIDTHLAPITNIEQRGSDLLSAGDQAAAPSYNLAMNRAAPVDPQLAAMLDTPAGKASLANARTIAANERLDPNAMGFDLNPQGDVVLKSVPSFKTLQLVKRGMDAHLNSFNDQFGNLNLRGNPLAQSVLDLKNNFNARLGELNPDYAEGNRIWSGFAQRKDALDKGYNVLPNNAVPQRQFDAALSGLTPDTLPEAQMGYATRMADTANKARMTSNPYSSIYGSPLQQQKVAALFPQGADNFGRISSLESDMGKTYREALGGSQTQPRAEADKLFESGPTNLAGDLAFTAATGTPTPGLIRRGLSTFAGDTFRMGLGKSAQRKAEQLGPILLNTDPAASAAYLRNMIDLAAARKQYMAQARAAGGMFAAPLAAPFIGGP